MPSREGHHPSLCATCNLWSTSCCQASRLTLSPTSSHCSQLEPFHAPADELQHGVRQRRVERAQTLQSAQHLHRFKGFIAMQKSYVNHILQLMLKSPLHLPCGHVLSVPHLVLVQGTPAPLLGALCMAQAPWQPRLCGASGQCLDACRSSHLLLLHLQTCTA